MTAFSAASAAASAAFSTVAPAFSSVLPALSESALPAASRAALVSSSASLTALAQCWRRPHWRPGCSAGRQRDRARIRRRERERSSSRKVPSNSWRGNTNHFFAGQRRKGLSGPPRRAGEAAFVWEARARVQSFSTIAVGKLLICRSSARTRQFSVPWADGQMLTHRLTHIKISLYPHIWLRRPRSSLRWLIRPGSGSSCSCAPWSCRSARSRRCWGRASRASRATSRS